MLRNSLKLCKYTETFSLKSVNIVRGLSVQAALKPKSSSIDNKNQITYRDPEWDTALPFEKIPGPSKLNFILNFFPGGRYHGVELPELHTILKKEYGEIVKLPGLFRRQDIVFIFDPNDFQKVFRTEGTWPVRRVLNTLAYYRRHIKPDIYKDKEGLVTDQQESWSKMRSMTNPIMLQPKTVKLYVPAVDTITKEFVEKIYKTRDENNEVPGDFSNSVHAWALETIAFIAIETRLGILNEHNTNEDGNTLIKNVREFLEQTYHLEFLPSLWLYFKTPLLKKQIETLNSLTEIVHRYVDKAIENLINKPKTTDDANDREKGVLEKLIDIDPHIARVMATDMLVAGVDTTGVTALSILYLLAKNQDKQAKLREEIMTILPQKDSKFSVENSRNLPYLRACIKEALRVKPLATGNMRAAGNDIVLKGYKIPKGVDITTGEYMHHFSEEMFPNANKFIPERWLKSENIDGCPSAKTAHPYAYMPFGYGVRSCIGKRFAELELEVFISKIIRNFNVEWHHPDIKFKTHMIIVPTGDLKFRFVDIKN